jgi:hypothetical protein
MKQINLLRGHQKSGVCGATNLRHWLYLTVAGDRLAVQRTRLTQQADGTWQADLPPQVNRKTDLPIGTHLDCLNNHFKMGFHC